MGEEVKEMKAVVELKKPHFVLIHGVSGGGWCWYKIRCLMENSGYKVTCLDLKSAGVDQSDANKILSFEDYNKPLTDFMSALPGHEQVILVGHSAGGLSVTAAIHKFAKKISLAVFVAATMLQTGFMTDQDVKDEHICIYDTHSVAQPSLVTCHASPHFKGVPDLSEFGDAYDVEFGLGPDQPPTSVVVKKELQRKIIYHMSPQEDSTLAAMLLRPGPIQALQSARFPDGDDNEVPRVYIKTTDDRVIKPEQQDAMIKRWPPSHVYVLESDHSPYFSAPFLLFGLLIKAASSVVSV